MRAVRLGNVYGSQGSVVPAFLQQISTAGPVTVTDPGVNRYFLSMDEAVERVLLAARLAGGGGIFIPDLGEPVRILDLARQLIQEAGLQPERRHPDCNDRAASGRQNGRANCFGSRIASNPRTMASSA